MNHEYKNMLHFIFSWELYISLLLIINFMLCLYRNESSVHFHIWNYLSSIFGIYCLCLVWHWIWNYREGKPFLHHFWVNFLCGSKAGFCLTTSACCKGAVGSPRNTDYWTPFPASYPAEFWLIGLGLDPGFCSLTGPQVMLCCSQRLYSWDPR